MKTIEEYITELKKISLKDEEYVHRFLKHFFIDINVNFNDIDDDDIFTLIHDFRVIFFKFMNDDEKNKLTNLICRYLDKKSDMFPQIIEYCGLIYKYLDLECKQKIFKIIINNYSFYIKTNRGIVALTTFIKYTNKTYNNEEKQLCLSIIEELKENSNEDILDTIIYTEQNLKESFNSTKKKVLLLIPEFLSGSSFLQPPLCFIRVKNQLDRNNIETDIFDNRIYNYSIDQVIDLISDNYQYIIITSTPLDQVQNFFVDHRYIIFTKTCNEIKKLNICKKLIVVGSHGTVDYKMLINDIDPDMIVKGEYDDCVYKAILYFENEDLVSLPNNFLYKEDNEWKSFNGENKLNDWNNSPLDFKVINLENYFGYKYINSTHVKKRRWAILQASRGCPFECTFCYNLYGRNVRFKNIEHIISEWKQLKSLACNEIFFIDQTFTLNKEYVKTLCKRLIEENILIPWQCETRIDCIDEEMICLMKKASCKAIWLGIESFDEDVLKTCKKGYSMKQLNEVFNIFHKIGMEYHAFIMVGMEGESKKSVEKSIDIIERDKIKLSKSIIQCTPRPGTEYYTHLPKNIRETITHFWQIDSLRGYSESDITDAFINKMVQRLLKISNES